MGANQAPHQDNLMWSLYNEVQGVQIDRLTTIQLQLVVASFNRDYHSHWLVWKTGDAEWSPLETLFLEPPPVKTKTKTQLATVKTEEVENEPTKELEIVMFNNTIVKATTATDIEMRKFRRKKLSVHATIDLKDKVFRTTTVDVSMVGVKLKDPLPESADVVRQVTLLKGAEKLEILCRLITAENGDRTRLRIVNCPHSDILSAWLTKK